MDREIAYKYALDLELAALDVARGGDPALIGRDFTVQREYLEEDHVLYAFTPCHLNEAELITPERVGCSASPGIGGFIYDHHGFGPSHIAVSVRSETWDDPEARKVIKSVLTNLNSACVFIQSHNLNGAYYGYISRECMRHAADAKLKFSVEIKPRIERPCRYVDAKTNVYCANPEARIVDLN